MFSFINVAIIVLCFILYIFSFFSRTYFILIVYFTPSVISSDDCWMSVKIMLDQCNTQNYTKVKFVFYIPLRLNFMALTLSGRVASTAYHEKPPVFPGGMPVITWIKICFLWKMNQQYRNFFNDSKIHRIRRNILKTRLWLFIRFRSNTCKSACKNLAYVIYAKSLCKAVLL